MFSLVSFRSFRSSITQGQVHKVKYTRSSALFGRMGLSIVYLHDSATLDCPGCWSIY